MGRVKARSLRFCEAAEMLGLSYRQSKRVWARYRAGGAKALQQGNCGRVSNRANAAGFQHARRVRHRWPGARRLAMTDSPCMLKPCGVGSKRLGCGKGNGDGNLIASGGKRRHTLAS